MKVNPLGIHRCEVILAQTSISETILQIFSLAKGLARAKLLEVQHGG
jgi:hypothetical protein